MLILSVTQLKILATLLDGGMTKTKRTRIMSNDKLKLALGKLVKLGVLDDKYAVTKKGLEVAQDMAIITVHGEFTDYGTSLINSKLF